MDNGFKITTHRNKQVKNQAVMQLKQRNQIKRSASAIEKRIRYLQRELVRASFMGEEKMDLCKNILNSIKRERLKIHELNQDVR